MSSQASLPATRQWGSNQHLGKCGEYIAANYLQAKNYRILHQNWRSRSGEIDLVTKFRGQIVFVEVKTRTGREFGHPFEGLTKAKTERFYPLCSYWFQKYRARLAPDISNECYRVDCIGITLTDRGMELMHQEGIGAP